VTETWGDGVVLNPSHGYCDDNNPNDGDGCSSAWAVEPGWTWSLGTPTSASTCEDTWGDGIVVDTAFGYWDDGNNVDGDGWDKDCSVESRYECTSGSPTEASVWSDKCRDGRVVIIADGYCDDGNPTNGDGWSYDCAVETGYNWHSGDANTASSCTEIWGDGLVMNPGATGNLLSN